jgi:putative addiction module CopG family antidote
VGAHFEQFIKDQVSGGHYASASEVVRDALALMSIRFTRQAERDVEEIGDIISAEVLIVRVLHGNRDLVALFSEQNF